jgi:hypothetical protein
LDRTAKTGRPAYDSKDRKAGTIELWTRELKQDSQDRTARTTKDSVARTGKRGQDDQNITARAG